MLFISFLQKQKTVTGARFFLLPPCYCYDITGAVVVTTMGKLNIMPFFFGRKFFAVDKARLMGDLFFDSAKLDVGTFDVLASLAKNKLMRR